MLRQNTLYTLIFGFIFLSITACTTGSKITEPQTDSVVISPLREQSEIPAEDFGWTKKDCGQKTAVVANDLKSLGFQVQPNRVTILRLMRSTCPTCQQDLKRMGELFSQGLWSSDRVQIFLLAYRKPKFENRQTFDTFVRSFSAYGIPIEAVQFIYLNKTFEQLGKSRNRQGKPLFPDWKAVPYGLHFARDGRLIFRGMFSVNAFVQEQNYKLLTTLQNHC